MGLIPGGTSDALTIWAVSDGRAGIEAQVLGLAEAVARLRPAKIVVKRIGWRAGLGRLPWRLIPPWARAGAAIAPPWPDIWIAAGRATLPLSTRVRLWSAGATLVVQTQDPRTGLAPFDLVIPPEHDGLVGPDVLPLVGAPNRLTEARLAAELARFADRLASLPHPRVALIVGGRSRAFALPTAHAARLADQVAKAVQAIGGSVLVSFTRRTPPAAAEAMRARLSALPGLIWDGGGENPYFAFLAAADHILVTEDSTNLAADAAGTGKPVFILPMAGRGGPRLRRFHADLEARRITRRFAGELSSWVYPPLRETDRAAAEVLRRHDARK